MADTFDLQNGPLSFSNPNFAVVSSDLNSNSEDLEEDDDDDEQLDELYEELDAVCRFSSKKASTVKTRRSYAHLGVQSMGVNTRQLENNLSTSSDDNTEENNNLPMKQEVDNAIDGAGRKSNGEYYVGSERRRSKKKDPSDLKDDSPREHRSDPTEGLYAVPLRKREKNPAEKQDCTEKDEEELLPPGWERHQDDDGPYYWHISSGTIQREPPPFGQAKRISRDIDMCNFSDFASDSSSSDRVGTTREEKLQKRRSYPQGKCSIAPDQKPIRFAVRSLGWVEIAEEDLTPERSSRAVNKCIVNLSMGRNDIMDVVGRWGDGKDLFMDLDDYSLRLVDTQDASVLHMQAIHSIRVWGVGRDNGRDFAYVARDRTSRKHMCHVFRCDMPARVIANTLRDICKKIMIERSVRQRNVAAHRELPESLGLDHGSNDDRQIFPSPMEEPRKVLKVQYLGSTRVAKPTGMETLNIAIDRLLLGIPREAYRSANVAVAPSTITVTAEEDDGKRVVVAECRVRFLSFLGIGRNVKTCAFIVHTAQEEYVAHVFHCEPSSGALCKTIEAACKLRYQKCLDARRGNPQQQNKKIGTAIRSVLGNITTRLSKTAET